MIFLHVFFLVLVHFHIVLVFVLLWIWQCVLGHVSCKSHYIDLFPVFRFA